MKEGIKEALRRYKVLSAYSEIELFIDFEHRIKFKITGLSPVKQLQCLNCQVDSLQIEIRITEKLERLAALSAVAMEKRKAESIVYAAQGLDLDKIIKKEGLNLDLME